MKSSNYNISTYINAKIWLIHLYFTLVLMKRNIPIQLKAAFLLIVFSMNMIIGFACAIGIDMWFNTSHHEETEITAHEGSHHHDEADKHHKSKDGKDNCCNDHVIKFSRLINLSLMVLPALMLYFLQL